MAWLVDLGHGQEWASQVRDALADQSEWVLEDHVELAATSQSAVGAVIADASSAELESILAAAESAGRRILVIGPPHGALDPWSVLARGASECVSWDSRWGQAAANAWMNREEEIEYILDSSSVRSQLRGGSAAVRAAARELVIAARFGRAPILIQGETGTGKEVAARVAHGQMAGTQGTLVVVDCTTIVPTLMGSELFGHERGAFTGAIGTRTGACAAADGGTLFLDEIGELPMEMQPELLRVLQEGTYKRVGGDRWLRSSFRLICATNRDLNQDVENGRFRADLYHRIGACTITMPPLRERHEDLIQLFEYFLQRAGAGEEPQLDPAVEALLLQREYPGNLRDLRQLAARVASRHVGPGPISPGDLPVSERPDSVPEGARRTGKAELDTGLAPAVSWALGQGLALKDLKEQITSTAVDMAMERGGTVHKAAGMLGLSDRAVQQHLARRSKPEVAEA